MHLQISLWRYYLLALIRYSEVEAEGMLIVTSASELPRLGSLAGLIGPLSAEDAQLSRLPSQH